MVTQMIYTSQPFGFDSAMLGGILSSARRNNRRDGVTGALICRHDIYLQMIEGDAPAIEALFARIAVDDRHLAVTELYRFEKEDRLFPAWDMLDDPARSWLWSPDEVSHGAATDASAAEVRAVFERLAAEIATG